MDNGERGNTIIDHMVTFHIIRINSIYLCAIKVSSGEYKCAYILNEFAWL